MSAVLLRGSNHLPKQKEGANDAAFLSWQDAQGLNCRGVGGQSCKCRSNCVLLFLGPTQHHGLLGFDDGEAAPRKQIVELGDSVLELAGDCVVQLDEQSRRGVNHLLAGALCRHAPKHVAPSQFVRRHVALELDVFWVLFIGWSLVLGWTWLRPVRLGLSGFALGARLGERVGSVFSPGDVVE